MTLNVTDYIEDLGKSDNEYLAIIKKVKKELHQAGIVPDVMPVDKKGSIVRPTIPPGIGDLHFSELTNLLCEFAAYSGYVRYQLAEFRIDEARASKTLKDIKAQLRLRLEGSPSDKSDQMACDKRCSKAVLREFEAESKRRLTEAVHDGVDKSFFAISRAITSLGSEKEQSDRDHKVGGGVPQDKKPDPFEKLRRRTRGRRG